MIVALLDLDLGLDLDLDLGLDLGERVQAET